MTIVGRISQGIGGRLGQIAEACLQGWTSSNLKKIRMEEGWYHIGRLFGSQTSVVAVGSLVRRVSPRKGGGKEE